MKYFAIIFVSTVCAGAALAGDINPPPGPVGDTFPTLGFKTLFQIEPRTIITQADIPLDINDSGSYYLGENLRAVGFNDAVIDIRVDDVTLDLNGFTIVGSNEVAQAVAGVRVLGSFDNITIKNGIIRNCVGHGIDTVSAGVNRGVTIEQITTHNNTANGILTARALVRHCVAYLNDGDGIEAQDDSLIEFCLVQDNAGDGITVGAGSMVRDCVARANGSSGISAQEGSTVSGNTTSFNRGDGIQVSQDCYVLNNICDTNGVFAGIGAGVHVTGIGSRIEGNTVTDNDAGIDVDACCNLIIRNSAQSNVAQYTIVANNKVGVIVLAPNSAAINGGIGGAGVGTSNPWANISF